MDEQRLEEVISKVVKEVLAWDTEEGAYPSDWSEEDDVATHKALNLIGEAEDELEKISGEAGIAESMEIKERLTAVYDALEVFLIKTRKTEERKNIDWRE